MKPILLGKHSDVSAFTSQDPQRLVLNSVNIREKFVEATNGKFCIRVPHPQIESEEFPAVSGVTDEFQTAAVPPKALAEAISQASKYKSSPPVLSCVRVSSAGDRVQLTTTDLETHKTTSVKPIEGQYPNMDQVIPTKAPDFSIALAAGLLKTIATWAEKNGKSGGDSGAVIRFAFNSDLDPVRFSIRLEDGQEATGVLMPVRMS